MNAFDWRSAAADKRRNYLWTPPTDNRMNHLIHWKMKERSNLTEFETSRPFRVAHSIVPWNRRVCHGMIHISCMMLGVFTCFLLLSYPWCGTPWSVVTQWRKCLATMAGCFGVNVVVWCVHILSPYSGYDQVWYVVLCGMVGCGVCVHMLSPYLWRGDKKMTEARGPSQHRPSTLALTAPRYPYYP